VPDPLTRRSFLILAGAGSGGGWALVTSRPQSGPKAKPTTTTTAGCQDIVIDPIPESLC